MFPIFKSKMAFPRTRRWDAAIFSIAFAACLTAPVALAPPVQAQPSLPTLGDGLELTAAAERKLGDRIIRELYRDPDYLDDAPLQEYVQSLLQPLLAAARQRGEVAPDVDERFAWAVLLGRDRSVNAFALPGGYFGVHLGLIGVVATPDELASVLAHELSHVTQRHISRLIAQQGRQTPLMIGALILSALAASKNPGAAQALMVGGQALAIQNQLNFSRDMEREADRIGYGLMQPAGFAPQGFVAMFDKLQQANRLNDNGSWPYLRSHPLTTQRIADMQSRSTHDAPGAALAPARLEHALLAARARVLMRPGVDIWRQWLAAPQDAGFARLARPELAAAWYSAALSGVQLADWPAARRALAGLRASVQGDAAGLRQARLLQAQLELAAGQPAQALAALRAQPPGAGERRPELLLQAQALLQTLAAAGAGSSPGELAALAERLHTWVTLQPQDAGAWQWLAQVWRAQGQGLRALRAEAEAQVAQYDYAAAVDRFRAGQELARNSGAAADFIEASIIDTRLRAVQSLLREQAAER